MTNDLIFPDGYAEIYQMFSNLLEEDYLTIIIITSRGTGKSYSIKIKILEWLTKTDRELIWLRRNFDNIRKSSLEPWKKILDNYCFKHTQEKYNRKDFEEIWEAITRGIKYKKVMRLHFIELYKSEDARELLDKNADIVMDEAIPNPKGKDKTNLKYLDDEPILYDELYGSAWRERPNLKKKLPRKIFVANPYDRFGSFMKPFNDYLNKHLKELKEKLWKEKLIRVEVEEENLRGEKEKALLFLFATEHKRELFDKEWDNFFLPNEKLGMIDLPTNYEIIYKIQGFFYCRQLRTGKYFFVSAENNKLPVPRWTEEICLINENYRRSERKNKRLLDNQGIKELVREYLEDLDSNILRFADFESRQHVLFNIIDKVRLNINL
ncbi:MAG: hypothetical protein MRERV_27c009 [Mycoplasmataceae bacterium RV_VA103A]|nr:MAG: hypothetical protein MRERV_27c009 [Mycoplasmataceae bacterium RV_VA103A]